MISFALLGGLIVVAVLIGAVLGRMVAKRRAEAGNGALRVLLGTIASSAANDCNEIVRSAELSAREEAETANIAFDAIADVRENELVGREAQGAERAAALARMEQEIKERRERLNSLRAREREQLAEVKRQTETATVTDNQRMAMLERRAEESAAGVRQSIVDGEAEAARTAAAYLLRNVDQSAADPDQVRLAKRIMGIAVGRFSGHYLTERLLSVVPLPAGTTIDAMTGKDEANLRAIESAANIRIEVTEGRDALRLEGLDGVAREVARRTFTWMSRHQAAAAEPANVAKAAAW